jgi:hypothetical protein
MQERKSHIESVVVKLIKQKTAMPYDEMLKEVMELLLFPIAQDQVE